MVEVQEPERFTTVAIVSETLSCTPTYVYTLISLGKLRAIKLGSRAVRVSISSLNAFVSNSWIDPDASFADPDSEEEHDESERRLIQKPQSIARSRWMSSK